jgi:cephalosporin-C deacetylase-like acetyl esterase
MSGSDADIIVFFKSHKKKAVGRVPKIRLFDYVKIANFLKVEELL